MRGDGDDGGVRRQPGVRGHVGQECAGVGARAAQRRQQAPLDAEPAEEFLRPGRRARVEEAGGGGVGLLGADVPGEPVGEQVGDHQQRPRGRELRALAGRRQLEDRVEGQMLQPGDPVQLLRADVVPDPACDVLRPAVAVVVGDPEQGAVRVEQPVVDGPAVDADRRDAVTGPGRQAQAVQALPEQGEDVPVQSGGQSDGGVGEAVHLVEDEVVRAHPAEDDAAAGGAEVDGGEWHVGPSCSGRSGRSDGCGRCGAAHRGGFGGWYGCGGAGRPAPPRGADGVSAGRPRPRPRRPGRAGPWCASVRRPSGRTPRWRRARGAPRA